MEIVSRENVKPSSPISPHLRSFDLSFIDVNMPPTYTGGLFFYRNNDVPGDAGDISGKLKKSLSETLTRYYPFAGRLNGDAVECNDEGALFVEARVGFSLSDLLENPYPPSLVVFLPGRGEFFAGDWPLVHVQVTFFGCGGVVVGICLSHKLADAKTFSVFVRGWSAAANGRGDALRPDFPAARVFPRPPDQEPVVFFSGNDGEAVKKPEYVTKRFGFEAEKIKTLRNRGGGETPTRFEAVTALLWRCAARTARQDNGGGVTKPSPPLTFVLDLRRRNLSPLLCENSVGNIVYNVYVETNDIWEMGHEEVLKKLRESKKKTEEKVRETEPAKTAEEYVKTAGEFICKKKMGEVAGYICTSWERLGLYEADLGFGKPIWVTPNSLNMFTEMFLIMDARDGEGREVWVSLEVEDMAALEKDEELLEFATLNPTIV